MKPTRAAMTISNLSLSSNLYCLGFDFDTFLAILYGVWLSFIITYFYRSDALRWPLKGQYHICNRHPTRPSQPYVPHIADNGR